MNSSKIDTLQSTLPPSEYSALILAINGGIYKEGELIEIMSKYSMIDFLKLNNVLGTFYEEIVKRNKRELFALFTRAVSVERICSLIGEKLYDLNNNFLATLVVNVGHNHSDKLAKIISESRDYSGRTAFFYVDDSHDRQKIKTLLQVFRNQPSRLDLTKELIECLEVKAGNFGTAFDWVRGERRSFILSEILDVLSDNKVGLKKFAEKYIRFFLEAGSDEDFTKFINKLEKYPDVLADMLTFKYDGSSRNLLKIAVDRDDVGKVNILAPHYTREQRRGLITATTSISMESALKKQTVARVVTSAAMSACYNGAAAVVMSPLTLVSWVIGSREPDQIER